MSECERKIQKEIMTRNKVKLNVHCVILQCNSKLTKLNISFLWLLGCFSGHPAISSVSTWATNSPRRTYFELNLALFNLYSNVLRVIAHWVPQCDSVCYHAGLQIDYGQPAMSSFPPSFLHSVLPSPLFLQAIVRHIVPQPCSLTGLF